MSALLLLTVLLNHSNANPCNEIEVVRALAVREQLPTHSLDALAHKYCAAHPPPVAASDDCRDLTQMGILAEMAMPNWDGADLVESKRVIACAITKNEERRTWPNGTTAKYPNGQWQYPDAVTAKFANGQWHYPDAMTAKFANGQWQYPNAMTARWANGTWQTPDATSVSRQDLLSQVCLQLGKECSARLARHKRLQGDLQILDLMALAWETLR